MSKGEKIWGVVIVLGILGGGFLLRQSNQCDAECQSQMRVYWEEVDRQSLENRIAENRMRIRWCDQAQIGTYDDYKECEIARKVLPILEEDLKHLTKQQ